MTEDILYLPDGRQLGYGIYGNPKGLPVIDFHGIPGSRREAALIASYIQRDDLCFIGFDRPGYGRSTPKEGYRIVDLPKDVSVLADHLNLERFIAFGYSGGGPFALACAAQIPQRISALGIVSGLGPADIGSEGMHEANRKKFIFARSYPGLSKLMLTQTFSNMRRNPQKLPEQLRQLWQKMPDVDRHVFDQDPAFAKGMVDITLDAIQHTVMGWVNEEILATLPWQFEIASIRLPNVFLWHGEQDRNVPVAMARAVAAQLPACQASFYPNEGHISLLYHLGVDIFSTLAAVGR